MEQTRLLFLLEDDLRIQLLIYKILRVHNVSSAGLETAAKEPSSQSQADVC